jgi:hypothetical protein
MDRNGRRRSKALQKNVSVYLGQRDGWQHEVLQDVCRHFNLTESEFFRELFLQRLSRWGLYDDQAGKPIQDAIERFRRRRNVVALPESLDHEEEDRHEWEENSKASGRRRSKSAL